MSANRFRRPELEVASLHLGVEIDLLPYATTGLRILAVGPSGVGKTNAGLLVAEQLVAQGWVAVIIDPEGDVEALVGGCVGEPVELERLLKERAVGVHVVRATTPDEFVPYAAVVAAAADSMRQPILLVVDEGQLFSSVGERKGGIGEATKILNDLAVRGRKRSLDLFVTAGRFSGSLHRQIFAMTNLKLIGAHADPSTWGAVSPLFTGTKLGFNDLNALEPGEFFCVGRAGLDKLRMPMSELLAAAAPPAVSVRPNLPTTYSQWDRAMRDIPTRRLKALSDPIVSLLSDVAGLTVEQRRAGQQALTDELSIR